MRFPTSAWLGTTTLSFSLNSRYGFGAGAVPGRNFVFGAAHFQVHHKKLSGRAMRFRLRVSSCENDSAVPRRLLCFGESKRLPTTWPAVLGVK